MRRLVQQCGGFVERSRQPPRVTLEEQASGPSTKGSAILFFRPNHRERARRDFGSSARAAALIALGCFLVQFGGAQLARGAKPDAIAKRHADLVAKYTEQLAGLADEASDAGLTSLAALARRWAPPVLPNTLRYAQRPAIDSDAARGASDITSTVKNNKAQTKNPPSTPEAAWRDRFDDARDAQAEALFALAGEAVEAGAASQAFPLLVEALRENPDHAEARKILGYERSNDRWLTPFEVRKSREKQVWHPRFGWLPAANVKRYEGGEQYYRGRWMKTADANRLGAKPKNGWDVTTEHYVVHTDHSLEEGVRLATRLERLYDVWQQMFAGFVATEEQLARRFKGQATTRREPLQHKVVLFRDRDGYIEALKKDQPNIDLSTGFYLAARREAYFYVAAEEEQDDTNLYHEATHQLFSEIRPVSRDIGRAENFWIIEGIACYMESLTEHEGWTLLGGNDAVRLRDAQHRLLVDNFYVPLAELTAIGMDALQRDPRIAKLYSQSAGLTHFLVHGAGGRYRQPLIEYLVAVYTGRDRADTLPKLTGETDAKLDQAYRDFLKSIP